jgi:hypothetical protein
MAAFYDNEGREWLAEKVGRTSGILSPKNNDPSVLAPHDIVRLSCTIDGQKTFCETTIKAGTLEDMSQEDFLELLERSRPSS